MAIFSVLFNSGPYFSVMTKKIIAVVVFATSLLLNKNLLAQNAIVQEGEFGVGVGGAHYFGDLNTRAKLNRAKLAATIFFRKNLGNYIAVRVGASFAQLGYSDRYNTHNQYMLTRNLSFNSRVWELTLQGDFNFFRFMPGEPQFSFTPYITLGAGIFTYDPYAYLKGRKVPLRPLGTEGQGSNPYSSMAISIPFGGGFKYALNERVNIGIEILHRFTNTDYLDDVSKTYPSPTVFPLNPDGSPSDGFLLYDRSYELGEPIAKPGLARGQSKQKDQFVTAMFHLTFNLQSYKCPTAK
jgi:hypothetical protein